VTTEQALLKLYPYLFGELEVLKSKSEDWLAILSMPLRNSIDSSELVELLELFGQDFVSEGLAELKNLLNPINTFKRITNPASDIKPTQVRWIVENVLKESALHLLAGDPNAGKSFLTLEIASQISRGGVLFGQPVQEGKVLLFGAEDSASDTVVPRLMTQNANLNNIFIYNEEESVKLPQDLNKIYYEVAMERPKLVIIDTVNSFLGDKVETNSDKGIRSAIQPLKKVADFYKCAIVLVTHKNKGNNTNALYSINGSIGYVGLARLVWLFAEDPDTEEKIFSVIKNNIGKKPSFKFELDFSNLSEFNQPKLIFLGETEELAQEVGLENKTETMSVVEDCCLAIQDYLDKQGRKESSVLETFITNDYSLSCYKRARKILVADNKIKTIKEGQRWYVEPVETLETVETLEEEIK
jgi:predicted ATP-dependent serine protease